MKDVSSFYQPRGEERSQERRTKNKTKKKQSVLGWRCENLPRWSLSSGDLFLEYNKSFTCFLAFIGQPNNFFFFSSSSLARALSHRDFFFFFFSGLGSSSSRNENRQRTRRIYKKKSSNTSHKGQIKVFLLFPSPHRTLFWTFFLVLVYHKISRNSDFSKSLSLSFSLSLFFK